MILIYVGGAVMGGKNPIVVYGGVSTNSCWYPPQDGTDCSEWRKTVNRDITHDNMQFFESF